MNVLKRLKLSKEALLFDSPLYLLKSFLAVMLAYVLFSHHEIIGRDMISVLFGMMLSLEPVSISGFKSGLAQFKATILGGVITALIVSIAGVNMITVPLAVVLTLYISLLYDWKIIHPVAFFTSIYMTQYIQLTVNGDPSMILTLRLRLLALGSGVLVAVVVNYIFGVLFYKSMVQKRTHYIVERFASNYTGLLQAIENNNSESFQTLKQVVTVLFSDIDLVYNHVSDLNREKRKSNQLKRYLMILDELRLLNHYTLDMVINVLDESLEIKLHEGYVMDVRTISDILNKMVISKSCTEIELVEMLSGDNNIKRIYRGIINIHSTMYEIEMDN